MKVGIIHYSTSRKTVHVTQFATRIWVFTSALMHFDQGVRLSNDESIFEFYNLLSLIDMTSFSEILLYSIMSLSHLTC